MALFKLAPSWLGLYVGTEDYSVASFVRDVYNGFPVESACSENGQRMVLEITEARGENYGVRKLAKKTGYLGNIIYNNGGLFVEAISPTSYTSLDFGLGEGQITVGDVSSPDLDTILRQITLRLAADAGFITLHSVCWLLDGKAYLSCGGAESGKTTIGELLKGKVRVLSDEFNFVGAAPDVRVWRTPMRPIALLEAGDENYPVGAMAFHRKGTRSYVKSLKPQRGFYELISQVFFGVFTPEREGARAFDAISSIVSEIPLFELGLTKDKDEILNSIMTIGGSAYE